MKRFAKITASLLALALAFGLVACGGGGSSSAPAASTPSTPAQTGGEGEPSVEATGLDVNDDGTVNNPEEFVAGDDELVFWSLFSGGDGDYMDDIIDAYNATGPAYKVVSVKLVWADYYTKLLTAVASGNGPDIGVSHVSFLPRMVKNGMVQSFDSSIDWANYTGSTRDSVTYDGALYATPLDTHGLIAYVNLAYFEQAGADPDLSKIKTEDDLLALLQTLCDGLPEDVYPMALDQEWDYPYRYWWQQYFSAGGSQIMGDDNSITIDEAAALTATEHVRKLFDSGNVMRNLGTEEQDLMFGGQKAALVFTGTWCVGKLDEVPGLDFTTALVPSLFGTQSAWADSHTFVIPTSPSRNDEKTQAAVDFITWASENGGMLWAESGQLPSNTAVANSTEFTSLTHRANYIEMGELADFPPQSSEFYTAKSIIIENLNSCWTGAVDPAQAVENMIDDLKLAIE